MPDRNDPHQINPDRCQIVIRHESAAPVGQ